MSVYNVDPEYSVSALNSNVPPSILPSMAQRPIPGTSSSLVQIQSQSSTQLAGGLLQINIPNSPNTYIKAGSSFLKMQVTLTLTGTATANISITGGNSAMNWASLILRATLAAGPNVLEQINQYATMDELLVTHAGSAGYFQGNMGSLYGQQIGVAAADGANPVYYFTVCIPVSFGLLNSAEELHFPLGLLNSGLQVSFDLQGDLNQAIYCPSGSGITAVTYSIANVSYCYEAIKVPVEHFASLRAQMASDGSLYQLPYVSALNMSLSAASGTVDQTFGVGLSSLKGVFSCIKPASAFGTAYLSARHGLTQWRALLDGAIINQYSLPQIAASNSNSEVEFYVDLQRALGVLGSVVRTAGPASFNSVLRIPGGAVPSTPYNTNYFWTGLGCNKFAEHGLTYTGQAVSQLQIHGETITGGSTMYLILFYDSCLFINAQGDLSVNR